MKQKLTDWLTILLTAVVGVLFIMWHGENSLFQWLVRGLGLVLFVPAVYEIYIAVRGLQGKLPRAKTVGGEVKEEAAKVAVELTFGRRCAFLSMLIVSAVAVVAGLWMIINPATFVGLLAYLLAAILVLFGVYQLVSMAYIDKTTHLPWFFYIVPAAFVVAGIIILFMSPDEIIGVVALIAGIMLVVSAVNSTVQMVAVSAINGQRRRDARDEEAKADQRQIPENVD